jgi:hypothetical protein
LAAWHADHVYSVTTVISSVTHSEGGDAYRSVGTRVDQPGWRVLDPLPPRATATVTGAAEEEQQSFPRGLLPDAALVVIGARTLPKRTRPPPHFSEAALLTAMETAGRNLEDRELADAMRESGLGTPATRAAIIETLIDRDYLVRKQKALVATEKAILLIDTVHPDVKSPALTGRWEAELQRIESGKGELPAFLAGIERYVTSVVSQVKADSPAPSPRRKRSVIASASARASEADSVAAADAAASAIAAAGPQAAPLPAPLPAPRTRPSPTQKPQWTKGKNGAWQIRARPGLAGQRAPRSNSARSCRCRAASHCTRWPARRAAQRCQRLAAGNDRGAATRDRWYRDRGRTMLCYARGLPLVVSRALCRSHHPCARGSQSPSRCSEAFSSRMFTRRIRCQ